MVLGTKPGQAFIFGRTLENSMYRVMIQANRDNKDGILGRRQDIAYVSKLVPNYSIKLVPEANRTEYQVVRVPGGRQFLIIGGAKQVTDRRERVEASFRGTGYSKVYSDS